MRSPYEHFFLYFSPEFPFHIAFDFLFRNSLPFIVQFLARYQGYRHFHFPLFKIHIERNERVSLFLDFTKELQAFLFM